MLSASLNKTFLSLSLTIRLPDTANAHAVDVVILSLIGYRFHLHLCENKDLIIMPQNLFLLALDVV